jgi:hypothetical protein
LFIDSFGFKNMNRGSLWPRPSEDRQAIVKQPFIKIVNPKITESIDLAKVIQP